MEDNLYASRIVALANKLIANNYTYVRVNTISNKVVLHIKNNEYYNDLDEDDKYNIMIYLQQHYNTLNKKN